MNRVANTIKNRLSLRPPQAESLNILAELADELTLEKYNPLAPFSKGEFLAAELQKVSSRYPTCTDFERDFPSMCFALATGVGKTRLMGAFVAYLYLEKGIRNFFVLAPNLTIYNKLIDDFSNTNSPKYVFRGIGEFVHNRPRIITGDNYNTVSQSALFESEVHINVFNISKINAETKGGRLPRIKRLSEFLGYSYFNYLSKLNDLVLLMDESHHYRADRGMEVINELNPILGLELTATPQVERSGGAIKFKNVVYEYSLAKAIRDGFVKEPAVATRKNFDPRRYKDEDLDRIKLEDGIRIHEDSKVALDIYSRDSKTELVKPFVLVVAKDTDHAGKLMKLITSPSFFDGYYADKVMEIHSNQRGSEKDENIAQLISLEKPSNKIEIVIHVNMLKEGWDVTNLYTIIPLRTATSLTLREQTIGRGLRLPYGKRTGQDKVDKLTIVAHDKFQEIIDEANKPDSIIKRENIIEIDEQEIAQAKEVVTVTSTTEERYKKIEERIEQIEDVKEKQQARQELEARKKVFYSLPKANRIVQNVAELKRPDIKEQVVERIKMEIMGSPQQQLFVEEYIEQVEKVYEEVVEEFAKNIIEIPRITIQPGGMPKYGFEDFDLDTANLNYQPVSQEILIKKLREQENDMDVILGEGSNIKDDPDRIIVNELINFPEIDYDSHSELLFKLAGQAIDKFKSYLEENKILNVVQYHRREIALYIRVQMQQHFFYEPPDFQIPLVFPFTKIEDHNYSRYTRDAIHDFRETITPTYSIPQKLFGGFRKACHDLYKFDSKTEKDFAIILEKDNAVLKWLRPAERQFHIYWDHNSKRYFPDFVVETAEMIYMVETKAETSIGDADVQDKARAALEFCKYASNFTAQNGGKPWKYVLIPHSSVLLNMDFAALAKRFERN